LRVALIAPPFISVPPADYGGTELFVAQLAEALVKKDVEIIVYTNGDSTTNVERRWRYQHAQWPIKQDQFASFKELDHTAWAVHDAAGDCDLLHIQSAIGLPCTQFVPRACCMHASWPSSSAVDLSLSAISERSLRMYQQLSMWRGRPPAQINHLPRH